MPAPVIYSNIMMKKHAELRKKNKIEWLYPDAKSQITFSYENEKPIGIDSIVFSTHHDKSISKNNLIEFVVEEIIKKTIPKKYINKKTSYYINPSNKFLIG